jgi:hypothetical protein
MCLACEEEAYFYRAYLVEFLARGEMPPGVTVDELTAMGLPLPGEWPKQEPEAKAQPAPVAAFACDGPND